MSRHFCYTEFKKLTWPRFFDEDTSLQDLATVAQKAAAVSGSMSVAASEQLHVARRNPLREGAHLNMALICSIPQPRFARMLPGCENLPLPMDEVSRLGDFNFEKFPRHRRSGNQKQATPWIKDIELANSIDDLKKSHSVAGRFSPIFENLDAWIATSLKRIIQVSNFKKKNLLGRGEGSIGRSILTRTTHLRV